MYNRPRIQRYLRGRHAGRCYCDRTSTGAPYVNWHSSAMSRIGSRKRTLLSQSDSGFATCDSSLGCSSWMRDSEQHTNFVEKRLGGVVPSEFTPQDADPRVVENRTSGITKVAVTDRRSTAQNNLGGRKVGGELSVISWFQRLVNDEVRERIVDDLALARTREHAVHVELTRSIPGRRNSVVWVKPLVNLSHSLFAAPVTSDLVVVERWQPVATEIETRI